MKIEWSTMMVRSLKGAPLSVLVIMMLNPQPITVLFLERSTGYTDETIRKALQLLEEYQLITHNNRYSWQLASGAMQLPLMNYEEIESESVKVDNCTPERNQSEDEKTVFPLSSSSCIKQELELINPLLDSRSTENENFGIAENRAECDRFGIREPAKSKLSRAERVTSVLIRYHCLTAPNTGAAIYRIEHGWKIKPGWIDPDLASVGAQTFLPEPENEPEDLPEFRMWEQIREELRVTLRKVDFQTWVDSCRMLEVSAAENKYLLRSGNSLGAGWIRDHALDMILEKTIRLTGKPAEIEVGW
jgi:predicted transcriptional regulator